MVEELHTKTRLGYRALSKVLDIPYPTLMRWQGRWRIGMPIVQRPGPKKLMKPNLSALEKEVREFHAHPKRTLGTGLLYWKWAPEVSRRDLAKMTERVRRESLKEKRMLVQNITWLVPGAVFALDESEWCPHPESQTLYLMDGLDLASRYVFQTRVGYTAATGDEVARSLRAEFERIGAPLFLKRDNGSNLNAASVDGVLEEYGVIPLNSPPYYSPYNGGVERGHRDVKKWLTGQVKMDKKAMGRMELDCRMVIHNLNHKPRRSLGWETPCRVFHGSAHRKYTKQERSIVYEWMKEKTKAILRAVPMENGMSFEAAWRSAAQSWLEAKGIIRVKKPNQSVTPFSRTLVS